jgi:hypothetical protein
MVKFYLNENNKKTDKSPDYVGISKQGIDKWEKTIPVYGYKSISDDEKYTIIRLYQSKYEIKESDNYSLTYIFDKKPENGRFNMPDYTGDWFNEKRNCKMALWFSDSVDFKCLIKIKNYKR